MLSGEYGTTPVKNKSKKKTNSCKSTQSVKICYIVSNSSHGIHTGSSSPFNKQKWVKNVCPIYSWHTNYYGFLTATSTIRWHGFIHFGLNLIQLILWISFSFHSDKHRLHRHRAELHSTHRKTDTPKQHTVYKTQTGRNKRASGWSHLWWCTESLRWRHSPTPSAASPPTAWSSVTGLQCARCSRCGPLMLWPATCTPHGTSHLLPSHIISFL